MARLDVRRAGALVSGVWTGVIVGIAFIGAPSAFEGVGRALGGKVVAGLFSKEAYASLAVLMLLLMIVRKRSDDAAQAGRGSVLSTDILLVFGALFCTLFGYFAIQPMLDAARAGQGMLSFGALHGISVAFFGLKALLLLCLTWRLTKP